MLEKQKEQNKGTVRKKDALYLYIVTYVYTLHVLWTAWSKLISTQLQAERKQKMTKLKETDQQEDELSEHVQYNDIHIILVYIHTYFIILYIIVNPRGSSLGVRPLCQKSWALFLLAVPIYNFVYHSHWLYSHLMLVTLEIAGMHYQFSGFVL